MVKYIASGNVMLDSVEFADGSGCNRENLGGPATFAYTGIKIWTDDVIQCSNVGEDIHKLFDPWAEKNNINPAGLKVVCDHCNHVRMTYGSKDGAAGNAGSSNTKSQEFWVKGTRWEDFGFMKTSPEDIEVFTRHGGVKGVYIAQNCDRVFWNKIRKMKERDGFKVMWEIEGSVCYPEFLDAVRESVHAADIFSLNIQEAQRMFGVEGDEACIRELQKLDVDVTLFRVGSRGLYTVTRDAAYHLPPAPCTVVDPTGCGNSSTGSALYAYAEGKDPVMVGIMANVASAMNIIQYGVIPDMLGVREACKAMADELYAKYSQMYLK